MKNDEIITLMPENYCKCVNIWNMDAKPEMAQRFYKQLVEGGCRG